MPASRTLIALVDLSPKKTRPSFLLRNCHCCNECQRCIWATRHKAAPRSALGCSAAWRDEAPFWLAYPSRLLMIVFGAVFHGVQPPAAFATAPLLNSTPAAEAAADSSSRPLKRHCCFAPSGSGANFHCSFLSNLNSIGLQARPLLSRVACSNSLRRCTRWR